DRDFSAHPAHSAHQSMPIAGALGLNDGHEIDQLDDALFPHEAGEEHRRVGEIHLLDDVVSVRWSDRKRAAAAAIQQAGEDTRRVEAWTAVPIDGAVEGYQRRRLQIADETMVADRWVRVHMACPVRGRGIGRRPETDAARPNDTHTTVTP